MRKSTIILIFLCMIFARHAMRETQYAYADADRAVFRAPTIWRTDGRGDRAFDENDKTDGVIVSAEGSVVYHAPPGTYGIAEPILTDGDIFEIGLVWKFTGEVTMEVTAAGTEDSYVGITNGVPLEERDFSTGRALKWRATLAPGSVLTEVAVRYKDTSGVIGTFGSPVLSGFMFRKPVHIRGTLDNTRGTLFHYPVPVTIGESEDAGNCDVYISGAVQASFRDVRFTAADRETPLSYWLEYVEGEEPARKALFWVSVPEIPEDGTLVYLYYGKVEAEDLSEGAGVFPFFDDFGGEELDAGIWSTQLGPGSGYAGISRGELRLDGARIMSNYVPDNAVIEYRARMEGGSPAAAIVKMGESDDEHRMVYSSGLGGMEHCVAVGSSIKVNTESPVPDGAYRKYKAALSGGLITFERYMDTWAEKEAEAVYEDTSGAVSEGMGLYTTAGGDGAYYDWIRVRPLETSPPEVDREATETAVEEIPNIAFFSNVTLEADGSLSLGAEEKNGEYISPLINSPFEARVIVPAWKMEEPADNTGGAIQIDIAAAEYGPYREDCVSGAYYYASKNDFEKGKSLRWRARFSNGGRVSDENRGLSLVSLYFRPGRITVISPNGGEILEEGVDHNIRWDASDYGPDYGIGLAYSVDGGKAFADITDGAQNTGRYVWNVPSVTGGTERYENCAIKVFDPLDKAVYDVSDGRFSIIPGTDAPAAETGTEDGSDTLPESEPEESGTITEETDKTGSYELLIKINAEGESDSVTSAYGYSEGDVVMIKPSGYLWGAEEREKFLIIQADLTAKEAGDLMKPEESFAGFDKDGKEITKLVRKRKYGIDIDEKGLAEERRLALRGLLRSKPFVERNAIEEKE